MRLPQSQEASARTFSAHGILSSDGPDWVSKLVLRIPFPWVVKEFGCSDSCAIIPSSSENSTCRVDVLVPEAEGGAFCDAISIAAFMS